MKKTFSLILLGFLISMGSTHAQDLYVSLTGSDDNPGNEMSPLASISKAMEVLDGQANGKTIWLDEGLYNIESGMTLASGHNGLTIRAMVGKNVILSGGKPVGGHMFKVVSDAAELQRVPAAARGKVYVAELTDELAGVFPPKSKYDEMGAVSWNGYRLNIAQYPNKGFGYMGTVIDPGPSDKTLSYSEEKPIGGEFKMKDNLDWNMLETEFDRTKDMMIHGYINNDWKHEIHRVGDIDKSEESIKLLRWTSYVVGNSTISTPRRVGIKGALCQLDQPGEWYFDRLEKKLYVWPIQPMNSQNPITILNDIKFFSGSSVEDITIRDITFQNFGELALYFNQSNNLTVAGCTFRSSDGMGVRMMEGVGNSIQSNDFYNMHQAFVMTGLLENRRSLINEHNKANNNHIHDCSFKGYGLAAILGVGGEFKNNLLHDLNGAFKFGDANDINIEYNEFYNMGYEMGDWNVIYSNDDYATRGNYIQHNFFHHMMEVPGSHGLAAVRQDGEATGYHVNANIMYKTGRAAVQVMGADNSVSENVVMESQYVWYTRQAPYAKTDKSEWEAKTAHLQEWDEKQTQLKEDIAAGIKSENDLENRTGQAEYIFGIKGWETNTVWKSHYPNLENTFDMLDPAKTPYTNSYTEVTDNYVDNGGKFPYHFHGGNTVDDIDDCKLMLPSSSTIDDGNRFDPDDMFNNPDVFDFTFKDDFVPVGNFDKWNFDSVGVYTDEYRRVAPDKYDYRTAIKSKYDGVKSTGGSFNGDVQNARYSEPDYLKLQHTLSILSSKPVVYFPLNESTGGKAIDLQNGIEATWQNGEAVNLAWENGMFYNAASLAGANSEYFAMASDVMKDADAMTLALWVKTDKTSGVQGLLNSGSAANSWGLELDGLSVKAKINGESLNANNTITVGEWAHVVLTWSNDGTAKLYVDGTEKASSSSFASSYSDNALWNMGALVDATSSLSGFLDDVLIFDAALTADEVKLIYMTGEEGISASTVVPVGVSSLEMDITHLILRDQITGALASSVMPSNAANQNVIWHSTDASIVTVDALGNFTTIGFGKASVVATTVDGGFTDTCVVEVFEEVSAGLTTPVAYWPFDEVVGNVAADVIGGHDAIWQDSLNSQNWEDGLFSRSGTFHGGDDDRFMVYSDPLAGTDSFTISVWFNLDATGQYEGIVVTRDLTTQHKINNWGISAERNHIDARWNGKAIDTDDAIYSGAWYNVVSVWTNDGTQQVYINGELAKSSNNSITEYVTSNNWFFGDDFASRGREIDGRIDELKMYDKALSAAEIKYLYDLSKLGISYLDLFAIRPESIAIEQESASMKIGETDTVSAIILPDEVSNKAVLWSSLDESVATVDMAGVIRGVSVGETKVVATTDDSGLTDTINVSVLSNPVISISVSEDSLSLMENKLYTLTAIVLPETATNKTFSWISSDEEIATIDDRGVITTINEGWTTIIARTVDGDLADTCVLEVKAIHVESLDLDIHDLDVNSYSVFAIEPIISPFTAKNKSINWASSDETVIMSLGDGLFSSLKQGTVSLIATTVDGGFTDSCVVRVDGGASAINETLSSEGIIMYPNPAKEVLNLSFKDAASVKSVEFINALGQVARRFEITSQSDRYALTGLASGYYLVRININDKIVTSLLMKSE